jgi:uncharacterized protein YbaP (TraB family)
MKMNNCEPHGFYWVRGACRRTAQAVVFAFFCVLALTGTSGLTAQDDTALYWSIGRDGEPAGFLLGTIHSEDPRVLDFSTEFIDELGSNQVFAMEMVPDLPALQRLTEYMQYQDGTLLKNRVGPERYARLQTALSEYQMPADWIARMKVWAAMMTLSVPPPKTGFFMDFSLSLRAAGAGLRVVGLETLEQQLSFLEEMPMEQQLLMLDQALAEYGKVRDLHDQMVDSYLSGNLLSLKSQAEEQLEQLEPETKQYFVEKGIDLRNRRMLESLLPHLQTDRVFVAVGALHLPGESGLIQLLRAAGYDLTPLPLPLNGAGQESDPGSPQ